MTWPFVNTFVRTGFLFIRTKAYIFRGCNRNHAEKPREIALLAAGASLGIVLLFVASLRPIDHQTAWTTWGYPFVWRSAASASPLYTYPLALYEDVAFWLVLSLAFVEFPVRTVALYAGLNMRKPAGLGRFVGSPGSSGEPQRSPSRSSLVVASAIIIAAVLVSASVFVASGWGMTTTETVTTTGTLVTTSSVTTTATTTTTSTVTSISTATVTCSSNTAPCGSFSYAPTGQVQVKFIQATQQDCQNCGAVNGQSYVYFAVTVENIGNSTIYVAGGTGELSSSVPANSSVIHQATTPFCPGTFAIVALTQGQNDTMYAPGCNSGVMYQLVQAGTVNVGFSFHWTTAANSDDFPDTTTVSSTFTFS